MCFWYQISSKRRETLFLGGFDWFFICINVTCGQNRSTTDLKWSKTVKYWSNKYNHLIMYIRKWLSDIKFHQNHGNHSFLMNFIGFYITWIDISKIGIPCKTLLIMIWFSNFGRFMWVNLVIDSFTSAR